MLLAASEHGPRRRLNDHPIPQWYARPNVLIFDVNETLIDIESLNPIFHRIFGDKAILREWFGGLIMYSMTLTLSGLHEDFWNIGAGVLKMVGTIHGKDVTDRDIEAIKSGMRTMPAHQDVEAGLKKLREAASTW